MLTLSPERAHQAPHWRIQPISKLGPKPANSMKMAALARLNTVFSTIPISFERGLPKWLLARPSADFGPVGRPLDPPVRLTLCLVKEPARLDSAYLRGTPAYLELSFLTETLRGILTVRQTRHHQEGPTELNVDLNRTV